MKESTILRLAGIIMIGMGYLSLSLQGHDGLLFILCSNIIIVLAVLGPEQVEKWLMSQRAYKPEESEIEKLPRNTELKKELN